MTWEFTAGLPETKCGQGSTIAFTEKLREQLPALFSKLKVKSILDIPCGDGNWMTHTNLSGIHYIGADVNREHVSNFIARAVKLGCMPESRDFYILDAVNDSLPSVELILCRDFLQHLTNADINKTIDNVKNSGALWFLATSHNGKFNRDLKRSGDYRPLNLMAAPFSLPKPDQAIPDGDGRILGLWQCRNL